MTAPLFLVDEGALDGIGAGATYVLDGAEGRHAATVRRIGVGERVDLADGGGAVARCTVTAAEPARLVLRVDERDVEPEPEPRFVLVQALAKGDRDDLAVEGATELGVDEVVPWQAQRSVVIWRGERGEKARRRWQGTVRAAAKQARRARVPQVGALAHADDLVRRVQQAALAVVLHEDAQTPLAGVELPAAGEVLLVVGPEGGVSPQELARLEEAGAVACRLGPHVLRSSTAGPAALAVLSAAARWG
ncbi:16S rRNA (uracil(1498)-N(3))-methyltransferase [Angustibacter sp. Root456]|uniref:16S rRNA (uracil(1498)-N(3))-methyltransferase n=1 Tax=Angustibacter sp. Root456 TaxID=1736539 RepID=UPI0007019158|nr:16S rRNA (uracil(1498)-N(3))-methyltransferase [Angustibacter sp. Root456]KQX68883.1 16S rRNA methyltransferase [Angustibacter sp. Root456]